MKSHNGIFARQTSPRRPWTFIASASLRQVAAALLVGAGMAGQAAAQDGAATPDRVPPRTDRIELAGPRFGITILDAGIRTKLGNNGIDVAPVISQFGWQFERQFMGSAQDRFTAVSELVLLVGGLDQGTFLPSASWLVGVRGPKGGEFGVGPNISPAGTALAIAAGITRRAGSLNLPLSFAVVPTKTGVRFGILGGFTMR